MKPVVRSTIQVLSLVALALMTIYLLPKNRNQFRYHYEIGQPWAYSLLVAESNFAIYKTPAELENDRAEIMKDYKPVYLLKDTTVTPDRYVVSYKEMLRLQEIGCYKISVINDKVVTPVALNDI